MTAEEDHRDDNDDFDDRGRRKSGVGNTKTTSTSSFSQVVVHPLVLLSVVDHFKRVDDEDEEEEEEEDDDQRRKRVVGVLLGSVTNGRLDVTSSFAVPFEEDPADASIWFLDHAYAEQMYRMHSRIHAKEKVVGWYSTGPKIRENDLDIGELFEKYCADPVLVIVNLSPTADDAPTRAYRAVLDVKEDGTMTQKEQKTYEHVSCTIEASDPEAIGVEHLLRDVKDATVSTLTTQVKEKARALRGLETRLKEIKKYMELVLNDQLPVNQEILGELQNAFNGLPNLNLESYVKAFAVETNDAQLVIYLGSLIRTVVALHDLINNKMEQKERERVSDMNDAEVANDAMKKKKGKDEESANNKENDKNESNKKDSSMKK